MAHKGKFERIAVLGLLVYAEGHSIDAMLRAGAVAVVLKERATEEPLRVRVWEIERGGLRCGHLERAFKPIHARARNLDRCIYQEVVLSGWNGFLSLTFLPDRSVTIAAS
jgi:hypothetical protein